MAKEELLRELHSYVHQAQDIWFYAKESNCLPEIRTKCYPNGVMAAIEGKLKMIHDTMEKMINKEFS